MFSLEQKKNVLLINSRSHYYYRYFFNCIALNNLKIGRGKPKNKNKT